MRGGVINRGEELSFRIIVWFDVELLILHLKTCV